MTNVNFVTIVIFTIFRQFPWYVSFATQYTATINFYLLPVLKEYDFRLTDPVKKSKSRLG